MFCLSISTRIQRPGFSWVLTLRFRARVGRCGLGGGLVRVISARAVLSRASLPVLSVWAQQLRYRIYQFRAHNSEVQTVSHGEE